jgi:hypothetical protein
LILALGNPLWQHPGMIEFRILSYEHPSLPFTNGARCCSAAYQTGHSLQLQYLRQ